MQLSPLARWTLRIFTVAVFVFLFAPLAVVAALSFNTAESLAWPPDGFTLHWWSQALSNDGARSAFVTSLQVATLATAIALVLGTLASFAVQRFAFFGRETVSFLLVLPIALPGIVTGIALNSAFNQVGVSLGFFTVVVAHATFTIVVVFNNVVARLRRLPPTMEEASADLGGDTFQTFRRITLPMTRTALLAGGLLAFGLSFDEIVVTTFTAGPGVETLPQWILNNLSRPNQLPVVNVVAVVVVILSIIPVYLAQRLTGGEAGTPGTDVTAP